MGLLQLLRTWNLPDFHCLVLTSFFKILHASAALAAAHQRHGQLLLLRSGTHLGDSFTRPLRHWPSEAAALKMIKPSLENVVNLSSTLSAWHISSMPRAFAGLAIPPWKCISHFIPDGTASLHAKNEPSICFSFNRHSFVGKSRCNSNKTKSAIEETAGSRRFSSLNCAHAV